MERLRGASLLLLLVSSTLVCAQTGNPSNNDSLSNDQSKGELRKTAAEPSAPAGAAQGARAITPIPANAPRMCKQTRFEIIRDFETQLFYSRTTFPMGTKGLRLKDGVTSPNGSDLQSALALWGPAIRPGDPARISFVLIKDDHIRFEINGGAIHRKKWYEHVSIGGANGADIPL